MLPLILGSNFQSAHSETAATAPAFDSKSGPWGRLRHYYFYLEAPDSVVDRVPLPDTQPRWRIPETELADFQEIVRRSSLPVEATDALFDPRQVIRNQGNAHLFPSHRLIEALSDKDRQQIYERLASYHLNALYEFPIFFLSGSIDEWAKGSGIRGEVVDTIRTLSYRRGNTLAFSDIPTLISKATSDSEVQFIKKKLTRTRTLIARLELNSQTDIPAVLNYWSTGLNLRRKELEPLITTTAALPGIQFLDILHLLPALPRKLLYTFPGDEFLTHSRLPDCHWTTLNFFNYSAQDYYLDTRLAASSILENFVPVKPPYRFGDVLMFVDDKDNAFHSCIYLADDLVYSKNGSNPLVPWVLIELKDLGQMYNLDLGQGVIHGFRHKSGRLSD
ncbi:MAG: hypothetical protein U0984_18665 [Prosthecobacter sp.]|nr:hypothetical protein [Prosthecobacter sp.]